MNLVGSKRSNKTCLRLIAAQQREAPAKRQFRLNITRVMDYLSGDRAIFVNRAPFALLQCSSIVLWCNHFWCNGL